MTSRKLITVQALPLFYFKTSEVESTDLFVSYTAGCPAVNTFRVWMLLKSAKQLADQVDDIPDLYRLLVEQIIQNSLW